MRVSLDRARSITGYAQPPTVVTERQFDYLDADLERLARTPLEDIEPSDLWYYFHDLAYVALQRDLFAYLFPACLWDWHTTLMANESCAHGDSEFHYSIATGDVFGSMLTFEQRQAVYAFLQDSMLDRLDHERGFAVSEWWKHAWVMRWNSLGLIMPEMERIWDKLTEMSSPGHAVAIVKYISSFMYAEGEHPLLALGVSSLDPLAGTDSMVSHIGWLPENVDFVGRRLTIDHMQSLLERAMQRLSSEEEGSVAQRILHDFPGCLGIVERRLTELPANLSSPGCSQTFSA